MPRRALGALLTAALGAAAAGGALVTLANLLDGHAFPGELLALFRVQWFLAGLALAAAAAIAGRRRIAFATWLLAALNGVALLPGVVAGTRPDPARPELRLLVANVWYPGDDYTPLLDLVEREQPDVIGLTELTREWARGLDRPLAEYRHRVLQPLSGGYGIGLYSRVPLREDRIVYPAPDWPPVARATVRAGDGDVHLFVVHGPSATGRTAARQHRAFMRGLGDLAGAAGPAALVCGDLNAAPWTAGYDELRDRGRLERDDAWQPLEWTYPVWNRLLRVPIDQCLSGDAIAVASETGAAIASDHFPLLVDVASARSSP